MADSITALDHSDSVTHCLTSLQKQYVTHRKVAVILLQGNRLFKHGKGQPPRYSTTISETIIVDKPSTADALPRNHNSRRNTAASERLNVVTRTATLSDQHDPGAEPGLSPVTPRLSRTDAPTVRNTSIFQDTGLPPAVLCKIVVFLDNVPHDHYEPYRLYWQDFSQYRILEKYAKSLADAKQVADARVYKKAARVLLIEQTDSGRKEIESESVETEEQWRERLPQLVVSYVAARYQPNSETRSISLEIRLEYGQLKVARIEGATYAFSIRATLLQNSEQNWEDKRYWPRKILQEVFTDAAIFQLLDEDKILSKGQLYTEPASSSSKVRIASKEEFAHLIGLFGVRLMATCLYLQFPLDRLYHMMAEGLKDKDIPITGDAPPAIDSGQWQLFKDNQGRFRPHDFPEMGEEDRHCEVSRDIVIPIQFNSEVDQLGAGSFGTVYKVQIHGDHHSFTPNKDTFLALKKFHESRQTRDDFLKERHVLQKLAKIPHPNITPYLASWTQDGRFYMLFPLAEHGNLYTFLRERPTPQLTMHFVLWLLGQMKAIASALDHIHNLGKSKLAVPEFHTGYHHDLTPQNILVFLDDVLCISDFGTARLHRIVSGPQENNTHVTPNLTFGNETYGAPDYAINGGTSRPYDIFSLGCIFLELLIWTFGLGDVGTFFEQRKLWATHPNSAAGSSGNASFWCEIEGKRAWCLKPPVQEKICSLEEQTKDGSMFFDLISLVKKMLEMQPSDRPDAAQVHSRLTALLQQATIDLKNPNFYEDKTSISLEMYGGPSTISGPPSQASSNTCGHPETPGPRPFALNELLTPDSPLRGYRRRSTGSIKGHSHSTEDFHGLGLGMESSRTDQSPTSHPITHIRQPSITLGSRILHFSPDTSLSDPWPSQQDATNENADDPMTTVAFGRVQPPRRLSDESHRSITV